MTPKPPAFRSIAATIRALSEGHQARRAGDGVHFLVKSEHSDTSYYVRIFSVAGVVIFECDHGQQLGWAVKPERTFVPCKHGARCALRLQREGLLRWDATRWVATSKAERLGTLGKVADEADDPFAGLPGSE